MDKKLSGLIITPMWREFMDFALEKRSQETFAEPAAPPEAIKPILDGIWFDPSTLLGDNDDGIPELSLEHTVASAHSILYYVKKDDPQGAIPKDPALDPQFTLWEYPISVWKSEILDASKEEKED